MKFDNNINVSVYDEYYEIFLMNFFQIFVVCKNYKCPDKIDPKFLDPKHVFSEVESSETKEFSFLMDPAKKKKAPAEGYENTTGLLYKTAQASEFILEDKPIHVLENCHEIIIDEPRIQKHTKTTKEIIECCKDVQILGIKELKLLKKWREVLRNDFEKENVKLGEEKLPQNEIEDQEEDSDEKDDDEDLKKLEKEIESLKDEERKGERRKKKNALKEKRKIAQKIDMKMIIPGDEGPRREEEGLFQVSDFKTKKDLDKATDFVAPDITVPESDSENEGVKPKVVKYSKENKHLDDKELNYKDGSGSDVKDSETDEDDDSGKEDLELEEDEESDNVENDDIIDELNEASENPLLVSLEQDDKISRKERKANLWFDKDIFQGIEEDEELEESDIKGAINAIKKKGGKIMTKVVEAVKSPAKNREYHSDSEDEETKNPDNKNMQQVSESDSSSSDDEEEREVKSRKRKKKEKRIILSPEELGEFLKTSDIMVLLF